MLRRRNLFAAILVFLPLAFVLAETPETPYRAIVERNIFGLNPPPPPMTNNASADQMPLNIKFTGITTLGNEKKAWFMVQSKDPKEPPTYMSLPEGERSGAIEVLKINETNGEVKVITGGKEISLNFKDNGNKANVVPMAPPVPIPGVPIPGKAIPGVPPPPRPPLPGATGVPPPPAPAFNRGNNRGVQLNSNIPSNLPPPPGSEAVQDESTSPALRGIPTRPTRTRRGQ